MKKLVVIITAVGLATMLATTSALAQENEADKVEQGRTDRGKAGPKSSVKVRTKKTSAVTIGDTVWVTVSIRGKGNVENLRFTAELDVDGSVGYPANTVDHSGPYNGYDLKNKETDYVAFNITISDEVERRSAKMTLSYTWTNGGESFAGKASVKVPLVNFDGSPYTLLTDTVTLTEADNGWVALSFAGLAPRVERLEVSISSPSGLDVYYPLETYTSLAGDDLLEDGETDVARFRINEAHWGQTLELELQVRYQVAGESATATHSLVINT